MTSLTAQVRKIIPDVQLKLKHEEVVVNKLFTYLIIVSMYFITADAFAQWNEKSVKKALKCYEENLTHKNYGIVKSSIQNIMKLKVVYPEMKFSKAIKKLEKLSFGAESKIVRYNAYVAANYLYYPEQFQWDLPDSYEELDSFFQNYEFIFDKHIAQTN